jgi:hypothetical protein
MSRHTEYEKPTAGSARETGTVVAAVGVTFETAPFFCVYSVQHAKLHGGRRHSFLVVSALISTPVCNKQPTIIQFRFRTDTAITFLLLHSQVSATLHRSPLYAKLTRKTSAAHLCNQCILTTTQD